MTHILKIAVSKPLPKLFDYLPPKDVSAERLSPGVRVAVPFGRTRCVGFVVAVADTSNIARHKLRRVSEVLDSGSLIEGADCELLMWAARYYHHPPGEVFACGFPLLLRQGGSAESLPDKTLAMTDIGRQTAVADLARSPRQAELLALLQASADGIPETTLATLQWDWRRVARLLISRGLAEYRTVVPVPKIAGVGNGPGIKGPELNQEQLQAAAVVNASVENHRVFLLDGVTGSGKTEVYLQVVEQVLRQGRQAMILLPEISLTPQLESRFRERIQSPLVLFHSNMTDTARRAAWLAMQRHEASVLLGTRSAVFTPMRVPGLIVIDEEHDQSFKQQEGFRYSARDVAVVRAQRLGIPVVLGSATPSLESLANVQRGRYHYLQLRNRAGMAKPPQFQVIDIRGQKLKEGLSAALMAVMEQTLARGEQILLFLNRRGYAPTLICHGCGWVAQCRRCDSNLVVHAQEARLRCHHCGVDQPILSCCTACGSDDLRFLGMGTERVEQVVRRRFPNARVARIDRDSTRHKGSLEQMLDDAREGRIDILLGTQMLAKGHHFPAVTTVGIIDVDSGLFNADFRSGERTAQLIVQVAGRAGRAKLPGTVILQTRHPQHPMLSRLLAKGYGSFAQVALAEREAHELPPYVCHALWRAESPNQDASLNFLKQVARLASANTVVTTLGPVTAPMERKAGRYRFQLLMQSASRKPLHDLMDELIKQVAGITEAKRVRWSVDIDPLDYS